MSAYNTAVSVVTDRSIK